MKLRGNLSSPSVLSLAALAALATTLVGTPA